MRLGPGPLSTTAHKANSKGNHTRNFPILKIERPGKMIGRCGMSLAGLEGMAIIRRKLNEIQCKVVYYGPGRCGKTTNLISIHQSVGNKIRGDLICINTAGDRTIFFDLLPVDLGNIRDMSVKISVYTVPGQVMYNDTRRLVLKGADGVVFVADSLEIRREENMESLQNLERNLEELGSDISATPLVVQYNKRDLKGNFPIMSLEAMEADLNPEAQWASFGASALLGTGVKETFKKVCIMTVAKVYSQAF